MKKFSFSTAALFPLKSSDALELIGKAGFKHAELMPQAFLDITDDFARSVEKTGVHVASIHYPLAMFSMLYNAHPDMQKDCYKFSESLVKVAEQMSTEVIVVHPHNPVVLELYELLEAPIIGNLCHLAELCSQSSITLAIENSPKGPGKDAEGLLKYIKELFGNNTKVGPVVDTTEACEAFQDPSEFIRLAKPVHLHLSDHKGEEKHLPAGDGVIDWNSIRAAIESSNFNGYYTLEPSYRFYINDTEKKLKDAYDFANEWL